MPTIGSRDFQVGYQKLTEVTRVEARGKYLGTWYPAGTETEGLVGAVGEGAVVLLEAMRREVEAQEAEIKDLKRRLAAKASPIEAKTVDDVIRSMAPQDREFFERRLGKKK